MKYYPKAIEIELQIEQPFYISLLYLFQSYFKIIKLGIRTIRQSEIGFQK